MALNNEEAWSPELGLLELSISVIVIPFDRKFGSPVTKDASYFQFLSLTYISQCSSIKAGGGCLACFVVLVIE